VSDIDTLIDRLSDRQRREFALWCAERVRHLMTDPRSTTALDVAARHLRGEATDTELTAARDAAWAAARDAEAAAEAARDAAWSAARDAAFAAARAATAAAWDAAATSARAAAWSAARDAEAATWAAARDAERAAQRAELERTLGKKINPASSKKKGRKK
jgi:hypothetical protein